MQENRKNCCLSDELQLEMNGLISFEKAEILGW